MDTNSSVTRGLPSPKDRQQRASDEGAVLQPAQVIPSSRKTEQVHDAAGRPLSARTAEKVRPSSTPQPSREKQGHNWQQAWKPFITADTKASPAEVLRALAGKLPDVKSTLGDVSAALDPHRQTDELHFGLLVGHRLNVRSSDGRKGIDPGRIAELITHRLTPPGAQPLTSGAPRLDERYLPEYVAGIAQALHARGLPPREVHAALREVVKFVANMSMPVGMDQTKFRTWRQARASDCEDAFRDAFLPGGLRTSARLRGSEAGLAAAQQANDALRKKLEAQEEQIKSLLTLQNQLKEQLANKDQSFEQRLDALQASLTASEHRADTAERARDAMDQTLQKMGRERDTLRETEKRLATEIVQLKAEVATHQSTLRAEKTNHDKAIQALHAKADSSQQENQHRLAAQQESLAAARADYEGVLAKQQAEIEALRQQNQAAQDRLAEATDTLKKEKSAAETAAAESNAMQRNLNGKVESLTTTLRETHQALRTKDKTLAEKQGEIESLEKLLERANSQVKEMGADARKVKTQLESEQQARNNAQQALEESGATVAALKAQVREATQALEQSQLLQGELSGQVQRLRVELNSLQEKLGNEARAQASAIAEREAALASATQRTVALEGEVAGLTAQGKVAAAENETLQEALTQERQEVATLTESAELQRATLQNKDAQLDRVTAELAQARSASEIHAGQLAQSREHLEHLNQLNQTLATQVSILEKQVALLENAGKASAPLPSQHKEPDDEFDSTRSIYEERIDQLANDIRVLEQASAQREKAHAEEVRSLRSNLSEAQGTLMALQSRQASSSATATAQLTQLAKDNDALRTELARLQAQPSTATAAAAAIPVAQAPTAALTTTPAAAAEPPRDDELHQAQEKLRALQGHVNQLERERRDLIGALGEERESSKQTAQELSKASESLGRTRRELVALKARDAGDERALTQAQAAKEILLGLITYMSDNDQITDFLKKASGERVLRPLRNLAEQEELEDSHLGKALAPLLRAMPGTQTSRGETKSFVESAVPPLPGPFTMTSIPAVAGSVSSEAPSPASEAQGSAESQAAESFAVATYTFLLRQALDLPWVKSALAEQFMAYVPTGAEVVASWPTGEAQEKAFIDSLSDKVSAHLAKIESEEGDGEDEEAQEEFEDVGPGRDEASALLGSQGSGPDVDDGDVEGEDEDDSVASDTDRAGEAVYVEFLQRAAEIPGFNATLIEQVMRHGLWAIENPAFSEATRPDSIATKTHGKDDALSRELNSIANRVLESPKP